MQITNFLHTQPTELCSTNSTGHVIAGTIIHLHYQYLASGAWFDVITCEKTLHMRKVMGSVLTTVTNNTRKSVSMTTNHLKTGEPTPETSCI
jgi:hypothetical protein